MTYLDDLLSKKLIDQDVYNNIKKDLGDKKLIINDGSFIPRDVYNNDKKKLDDIIKNLEKERDEKSGELDKLKKAQDDEKKNKMSLEELQKQIQEKDEALTKAQKESILKTKRSRVDVKLLEAGVKEPKYRKALLREIEDWDEVKLSETDDLIDFDDRVEALKKDFSPFFGEKQRAGTVPNVNDHPDQTKYENMTDEQYIKAREEEGIS